MTIAAKAVEVRDLVKVYPRPGGGTLRAVDDISFEVRQGEFFGFLGPNGAGKTTTLEIIEGLRRPTSGEVRVLGIDPLRDLDRVKRTIGVQLQASSYFSLLTIEEMLELFGSFYPRRRSPAELLAIVGLSEQRKAYVHQLSGGQVHRFSVAAALVNDPDVLFLDEPTTGLDPQMRHGPQALPSSSRRPQRRNRSAHMFHSGRRELNKWKVTSLAFCPGLRPTFSPERKRSSKIRPSRRRVRPWSVGIPRYG